MKVGVFPAINGIATNDNCTDICRDGITGFRKLHKIGFGTYGSIYLAIHRSTSDLFALKKFKFPDDKVEYGLPRSAVREIRILKELTGHGNIVDCHGVLVSSALDTNKGSIYMVLGFAEHDLVGLLELWKRKLTIPEVKCITMQLLQAVDFCHMKGIVHRDLKCANLLIQKDGTVKLADFGLAREYAQDPLFDKNNPSNLHMTSKVITLWYRPPELLLGSTEYGPEIDLWSVGAILGELILQRPVFSADKEMGVFGAIIDELGPPSHSDFFKSLPLWKDFLSAMPNIGIPSSPPCRTETSLSHTCSRNSWDLVSAMLSYLPASRISAAAAMDHEFFSEIPLPCLPNEIRLPPNEFCHGMAMKQKRERSDREDLLSSGKKSKH